MRYTVYFEIFGKKMKTDVDASSEAEAKEKVSARMIFHRVEKHREKRIKGIKGICSDFYELFGIDIFKY